MSVSVSVSMDTNTDTPTHIDIWTFRHMDMDIWTYGHTLWTFRHMDERTCCRNAGYDYSMYIHCFENPIPGMLKIKKTWEFAGLFRRLFTVDVLSH